MMVAMPIYGKKTLKIFISGLSLMNLKLGMQHWGLTPFQVYPNDDPWLTLSYFKLRSNWVTRHLYAKKAKHWIFLKP